MDSVAESRRVTRVSFGIGFVMGITIAAVLYGHIFGLPIPLTSEQAAYWTLPFFWVALIISGFDALLSVPANYKGFYSGVVFIPSAMALTITLLSVAPH